MKIYNKQGTEIADVTLTEDSACVHSLMQIREFTLKFSLPEHIEIPIGSYCDYKDVRYTLYKPENLTKHHSRNFEYTAIFESVEALLAIWKTKDIASRRLKFSLTAKPHEFLQMIVDNLNLREAGWTTGSYIEAAEKTISFNHNYLIDALRMISDEFETEYEINGKTISLRKVEYNKENPLPLSYGKGNGFITGVKRENYDQTRSIDILHVQGGSRNIDSSKYKNPEGAAQRDLLLPVNQELIYEGKTYKVDADGFSIRNIANTNSPATEDSLDCTHIYPKRVGEVTEVVTVDAAKNFYDIKDSTIPATLDYSTCIIKGDKATIVFQSGMLAGREFDIATDNNGNLTGYIHAERKFKIVPQEYDGEIMPGGTYMPQIGDQYAIFNIMMPDAYIRDDSKQEGASWEMFKEAAKYLSENEVPRFSFKGELDAIYARKNWLSIGGKIKLGSYVQFSDAQFQSTPTLIRIIGIKDYPSRPYAPEIELSNITTNGSFYSAFQKVEAQEVVIEDKAKEGILYTKRSYRDAKQTTEMLQAAFDNFTGSISPVTIDTMQLLVGDEALQFRFVTSKVTPSPAFHKAEWETGNSKFVANAGIIQHMTLGITSIQPQHATSAYKFWSMNSYESPAIDPEKAYYFYAKCPKSGAAGSFTLSEYAYKINGEGTQVGQADDILNYYFLYGILNSEYEGNRSFVKLYGFTEILPGRITTDLIASQTGNTFFDLANDIIQGNLSFRAANGSYKEVGGAISESANELNQRLNGLIGNPNLVQNSMVAESSNKYGFGHRSVNVVQGKKYTFSANGRLNGVSSGKYLQAYVHHPNWDYSYHVSILTTTNSTQSISFIAEETGVLHLSAYYYDDTAGREGTVTLNWYKIEEGEEATAWRPANLDTEILYRALEGSTDIIGGLIATNLLMMKNESGQITAGISGLESDEIGIWLGGNQSEAQIGTAKTILRKDGTNKFSGKTQIINTDNQNFKVEINPMQQASLNDIINQLGLSTITITADSPVSDYRQFPLVGQFGFVAEAAKNSNSFTLTKTGVAILDLYASSSTPTTVVPTASTPMFEKYLRIKNIETGEILHQVASTSKDTINLKGRFLLPSGTYRLEMYSRYSISAGAYTAGVIQVSVGWSKYLYTEDESATLIGTTGLTIISQPEKYVRMDLKDDEVMKTRGTAMLISEDGTKGIRVTNSGIEVTTNSGSSWKTIKTD